MSSPYRDNTYENYVRKIQIEYLEDLYEMCCTYSRHVRSQSYNYLKEEYTMLDDLSIKCNENRCKLSEKSIANFVHFYYSQLPLSSI